MRALKTRLILPTPSGRGWLAAILLMAVALSGCRSSGARSVYCEIRSPPPAIIKVFNKTKRPLRLRADKASVVVEDSTGGQTTVPTTADVAVAEGLPGASTVINGGYDYDLVTGPSSTRYGTVALPTGGSSSLTNRTIQIDTEVEIEISTGTWVPLPVTLEFVSGGTDQDFTGPVVIVVSSTFNPANNMTTYTLDCYARYGAFTSGTATTPTKLGHAQATEIR
jgi:hypothetical protein